MTEKCAYCGSRFGMTKDHVVPYSVLTSSKRKGGAHSVGKVIPACSECNTALGSKYLLKKYKRSLYLVEFYAHKILFYEDQDSIIELTNKLKQCVLSFEAFYLEEMLKDDEIDDTGSAVTEELTISEESLRIKYEEAMALGLDRILDRLTGLSEAPVLLNVERWHKIFDKTTIDIAFNIIKLSASKNDVYSKFYTKLKFDKIAINEFLHVMPFLPFVQLGVSTYIIKKFIALPTLHDCKQAPLPKSIKDLVDKPTVSEVQLEGLNLKHFVEMLERATTIPDLDDSSWNEHALRSLAQQLVNIIMAAKSKQDIFKLAKKQCKMDNDVTSSFFYCFPFFSEFDFSERIAVLNRYLEL